MSLNSLSTVQKNKTYAPIILGISILLAIFWAFPAFSSYSDASMSLLSVQNALSEKNKKIDEYAKLEHELKDENNTKNQLIKKISKDFEGSDILATVMLNNSYTQATGGVQVSPKITISQISLDRGDKLPNGVYQGKITMNLSAKDVDSVVDYLNYLTTLNNYAFSLSDITLPIDTRGITSLANLAGNTTQSNISLPVTLGVYYYP